jgi:hypothetical protein
MNNDLPAKGTVVYPAGIYKFERGVTTGGHYPCPMDGCPGTRLAVKWYDGKMTYPCTKGMTVEADGSGRIG